MKISFALGFLVLLTIGMNVGLTSVVVIMTQQLKIKSNDPAHMLRDRNGEPLGVKGERYHLDWYPVTRQRIRKLNHAANVNATDLQIGEVSATICEAGRLALAAGHSSASVKWALDSGQAILASVMENRPIELVRFTDDGTTFNAVIHVSGSADWHEYRIERFSDGSCPIFKNWAASRNLKELPVHEQAAQRRRRLDTLMNRDAPTMNLHEHSPNCEVFQ